MRGPVVACLQPMRLRMEAAVPKPGPVRNARMVSGHQEGQEARQARVPRRRYLLEGFRGLSRVVQPARGVGQRPTSNAWPKEAASAATSAIGSEGFPLGLAPA